jgi:hypothetical protein
VPLTSDPSAALCLAAIIGGGVSIYRPLYEPREATSKRMATPKPSSRLMRSITWPASVHLNRFVLYQVPALSISKQNRVTFTHKPIERSRGHGRTHAPFDA